MPIATEVLHKCRKGDPQAQFQLYKQYYALIRTVCKRYSAEGQDLNVLINESFFRILTGINMYQVHIPFESWAKKVAIHVVIDDHRKQKNYRQLTVVREITEWTAGEAGVDWNTAEKKFSSEELDLLLRELPDLYRKTFSLYAIDGFSHREIADMLLLKEGTSKWYVSEARSLLKEKLNDRLKKNENLIRGVKEVR